MHGVQGVSAHPELHALESGRLRLRGRQGEDDGRDLRQRSHQVSSPGWEVQLQAHQPFPSAAKGVSQEWSQNGRGPLGWLGLKGPGCSEC